MENKFTSPAMRKIKLVVICVLAIALNFFSVFIFYDTLKLPLFMDTIFTLAVLFYAGLLPALIVQISYNIINSFVWMFITGSFDVFMLMYTICGILIVVSSWLVARHKKNFEISPLITILYLLLIAMLSSACSVISGGIIDYFHLRCSNIPDMISPIKKFTDAFVRQRFSLFVSCILAQVPVSFADRLITTFAGWGVYKIMRRCIQTV